MNTTEQAQKHYDYLLAEIYSWMSGDFETRVNQTKEFFIKHNITPAAEISAAVDLGSGHGIQSAALAALGFKVTAVDFNDRLLNELKKNCPHVVNIINSDITGYDFSNVSPEVVVCMGDTITHLDSFEDIKKLTGSIFRNLKPVGKLVLSFRDLTNELKGTQRFINVKSDDSKILTCFLEYFNEYVNVTDILHYKVNGKFEMKLSSYRKLKISAAAIISELKSNGFNNIIQEQISGMHYIISEKTK